MPRSLFLRLMASVCFNAEGGGGGGAAPATPAAPAASAEAPASTPAQPAAPVTPPAATPPAADPTAAYYPEGLADHLRGATDMETIDKMNGALAGYRTSQGERGEVPKDAAGYNFTADEKLTPYFATEADKAIMGKVSEAALKHGITTKQFTPFVNDLMKSMVEGGLVDAPYDARAEAKALFPDIADDGERFREVDRRVRDNTAWIDVQVTRGLDQGVGEELKTLLDTAKGVQAVEYIRAQLRETGPVVGGGQTGAVTEAQLSQRTADPRNTVGDPKYDSAFAAETDAMYRRFYGDAPRA